MNSVDEVSNVNAYVSVKKGEHAGLSTTFAVRIYYVDEVL